MIVGAVLGAGGAKRFGEVKQLAPLAGRPLIEHALAAMNASPVDDVVVVLGAAADEILARIDLGRARPVIAPDWRTGMAASLRAVAGAVPPGAALVVVLADQPCISSAAIGRIANARTPEAVAVRATYGGVPGHPVLLEPEIVARLGTLTGDDGAAALLRRETVHEVACDGLGDPRDVDRPEDLAVLARSLR